MLLGHWWWPKVKCWPVTPLRSSEVTEATNRFLQITWDWEELETWKWSQCVCLVNTLRLICNLGQAVTLTWGQILTLTFQGHAIHVSMRLDEANTMVAKLLLYHFKHRSYHWKTVSLKNAVFDLPWPLTLKRLILGEICRRSIERAFQELSFAFFGFGIAIIVPEIMAGIPDKTIIFRKFDLWWPLLTSIFTWAKKWPKWLRTGSLRAVDRRIARPSSFPSFRVRGGGHFGPPPPWRRFRLRPPPGRGLNISKTVRHPFQILAYLFVISALSSICAPSFRQIEVVRLLP